MESARHDDTDSGNSKRETEDTGGEENIQHLEYLLQAADDGSEANEGDPFPSPENFGKSSEDEGPIINSDKGLFENNSELEQHIDKEDTSGCFTDQSSNANASHSCVELDPLLSASQDAFEYLLSNPLLPATGNEIPPSSYNVSQILDYPTTVAISREIEPPHSNPNESPEISDSAVSQNIFRGTSGNLVCEKGENNDGKSFSNVFDTGSIPEPCHSDHNYAAKYFPHVLQNADSVSGSSHTEDMTTVCEN